MSNNQTIKAALDRAVRTVSLRPERGQRVYRNVAVVRAGTLCHVEEAGQTLTVDVGKSVGGNGAGPNPSMVLRSAMTSCVAIGIKQWAARRGMPVDHVEVVLETDVDARGQLGVSDEAAPGFEGVRLMITVTSPADPTAVEDLVARSLKCSPLMDVFVTPLAVERRLAVVWPDLATQEMELP